MIGQALGRYRLVSELGRGGMGVVYRAKDERLGREVALKVLPPGFLSDEASRKRFRQEATLVSRLNHPNIETVHDFDTEDGVDFLVMELIQGEGLDARVARGPLDESEILALGLQLAAGLEAAHEKGLVHRDLKPGNLRVTPKGQLKILDFGLAKVLGTGPGVDAPLTTTVEVLSQEGTVLGTLPYMAPEQLRGEMVDGRTDVHGVGVVLYELATGRRPHGGETQAVLIDRILNRAPASPRGVNRKLSAGLEAVILRALAKDPAHRYQTARELREDLERLVASQPVRHVRRPGRRRALALGASVVVAVAGVMGIRHLVFPPELLDSLAVLPIENITGDQELSYLSDGVTESLINRLARLPNLKKVIAFGSVSQFRGKNPTEAGRQLNVRAVLIGKLQKRGDRWTVRAELMRVNDGQHIWGGEFAGAMAEMFKVEESLAREIADGLRFRLSREGERELSRRDTEVGEAYRLYLKGRHHFNRYSPADWNEALKYFQEAIDHDPGYAMAYAGLADTYTAMSSLVLPANEAMVKAKAAARKALEVNPSLAEARSALAYVTAFHEWRWAEAEAQMKRAINLKPGNAVAHANYGYLLAVHKRFEESSAELQKAWELDPLSSLVNAMTLWPLNMSRRYHETIVAGRKLLAADPANSLARMIVGQALVGKGEYREGLVQLQEAGRQMTDFPGIKIWIAYAFAQAGEVDSVLAVQAEVEQLSERVYVQPYFRAMLCTVFGDKDGAFRYLDEAVDQRSEELVFLQTDIIMDPLRSDPRFPALLARVGFEP